MAARTWRCDNCGVTSGRGRRGDRGSEFADQWFCSDCWRIWEEEDLKNFLPLQKSLAPAPQPSPKALAEDLDKGKAKAEPAPPTAVAPAHDGGVPDDDHPGEGALSKLSMADLRGLCSEKGIPFADCIEKEELVSRILHPPAVRSAPAPVRSAPAEAPGKALEAMSVPELQREARTRGVDVSSCVEKSDLLACLRGAARPSDGPPEGSGAGFIEESVLIEEADAEEHAGLGGCDGGSEDLEEIDMELAWRAQRKPPKKSRWLQKLRDGRAQAAAKAAAEAPTAEASETRMPEASTADDVSSPGAETQKASQASMQEDDSAVKAASPRDAASHAPEEEPPEPRQGKEEKLPEPRPGKEEPPPLSLREAVLDGNADAVRAALAVLGKGAKTALESVDDRGLTPLHHCAARIPDSSSPGLLQLLLDHSAPADAQGSEGQHPLVLAIRAVMRAESAAWSPGLEVITVLLRAGSLPEPLPKALTDSKGMLAKQHASPVAIAIVSRLLDARAYLPWHGQALRRAVDLGDARAAEQELKHLGSLAPALVNAVYKEHGGGSLLHLCAERACCSGSASIAALLLAQKACVEQLNAHKQVPLAIAVSEVVDVHKTQVQKASGQETVAALVEGGLPQAALAEWYPAKSALSKAVGDPVVLSMTEQLLDAGADLPWHPRIIPDALRKRCREWGVPVDTLGRCQSENVMRACDRWEKMTARELRVECQTKRVDMSGCVEKAEIQLCLCKARVEDETAIMEDPRDRVVGTWCYSTGQDTKEYVVAKDGAGQYHFSGQHATMGEIAGALRQTYEDEYLADHLVAHDVKVGEITLVYSKADRTLISQYKGVGMLSLGKEITAVKRRSQDKAPVLEEQVPDPWEEFQRELSEEEEHEDILTAADLEQAFMAAVRRRDLEEVQRGLERAREESGSHQDLAQSFDEEMSNAFHWCIAGTPGQPSKKNEASLRRRGLDIIRLLAESQADVNEANSMGETPLMKAVQAPVLAKELVQALLELGAEPNSADEIAGETALMLAACEGSVEICKLLLQDAADPSLENVDGATAHDLAADRANAQVARLLRSVCPTTEDVAVTERAAGLWDAVESCDLEEVWWQLEKLGKEAARAIQLPSANSWSGRTLLHVCACNAREEAAAQIAHELVRCSALPDRRDLHGTSPLDLAVQEALTAESPSRLHATTLVRVLLAAGASPCGLPWSAEDCELACACRESFSAAAPICKLLLSFGADLPWYGELAEADKESKEQEAAAQEAAAKKAAPEETSPRETASKEAAAHEDPSSEEEAEAGDTDEDSEAESSVLTEEDEGVDITERCMREAVPLQVLGTEKAMAILRHVDRWRSMRIEQLRFQCSEEGVPTSGCVEKGELEARLKQALIWQELPESSLEKECTLRGISLAFDFVHRSTKEEALKQHEWGSAANGRVRRSCEEKGIPYDRLDLERAAEVLRQVQILEAKKISDLKDDFAREGLSLESGMEKKDMLAHLKEILIWQALPIPNLIAECKAAGIRVLEANQEVLIQQLKAARFVLSSPPKQSRFHGFFDYKKEQEKKAQEEEQQRDGGSYSKPPEEKEDSFARAASEQKKWQEWAHKNFSKSHPNPFASKFPGRAPGAPHPQKTFPKAKPKPAPPPRVVNPEVIKHLRTLELDASATPEKVKKQFKALSLKHHPDKNQGSAVAEKKFKEVSAAYEAVCAHFKLTGVSM